MSSRLSGHICPYNNRGWMSTLFTLKLQNSFDLGLEELEVEYKDGETTRLEVWIRSGEGDF